MAFNINLFERIFVLTSSTLNSLLSFVAEVTPWTTVDDNESFGWSRLHCFYCNANKLVRDCEFSKFGGEFSVPSQCSLCLCGD